MADIKSPADRSRNMAAIKNKDTTPEIYLRKKLFSLGYRYRKNTPSVIGHPDIWMKRYKTAVFINGCFWHRHSKCKYAYTPKSRITFWEKKFSDNIQRDLRIRNELYSQGIKCLIVWECTIKNMKKHPPLETETLAQIQQFLNSPDMYLEI